MKWLKFKLMVRRLYVIYMTRWALQIERRYFNVK